MVSLSLCMIVRDEEEVLARCLSCVEDIADEIIIVDTGSIDKTKLVAADFTDYIYDFPWCDDFGKARNFSFSKATKDYIMWLDADDVLLEKDRILLMALKESITPETDMIMAKYDVAFDEHDNPTFSYYRERLFKRSSNPQWDGEIHEVVPMLGNIRYEELSICHKKTRPNAPERNLKIFEKMKESGKVLEPRKQFYYARELYYNEKYEAAIAELKLFLESKKGWLENEINACQDLASCYYKIGQQDLALESLLKSFSFDKPRAEICCDIGHHFFERTNYRIAAYWYESALSCEKNEKNGGFCQSDCYGYIPCMQLCVCYDKMGNRKKAEYFNEKAGKLKPNDQNYLYNKSYFNSLDGEAKYGYNKSNL